jgi:hypothetical protein
MKKTLFTPPMQKTPWKDSISINLANNLPMKEKLMIRECLKLIHFGIGNTLITFEDKYFEYDGDWDVNDKGLTIRGYESAWLADLVAAYVLENTTHLFVDAIYDGIYRDDGLVVFKGGNRSKSKITDWLEKFQEEVNKVTKYDDLQLTVSIWGAEKKEDGTTHEKVTVEQTDYLPFLDMKVYWDMNENLAFTVYQKPGQEQLKYLNKDSIAMPWRRLT